MDLTAQTSWMRLFSISQKRFSDPPVDDGLGGLAKDSGLPNSIRTWTWTPSVAQEKTSLSTILTGDHSISRRLLISSGTFIQTRALLNLSQVMSVLFAACPPMPSPGIKKNIYKAKVHDPSFPFYSSSPSDATSIDILHFPFYSDEIWQLLRKAPNTSLCPTALSREGTQMPILAVPDS